MSPISPRPERLFCRIFGLAFAGFLALPTYLGTGAALAANGDCGQPQSGGSSPSSTDCLFILQAAVEITSCDPACVCDIVGSDGVSASDALVCLQGVVGNGFPFDCPCGDTTTTTLPPALSVTATIEGDAVPGGVLDATADVTLPPGCSIVSIEWTQASGATAAITGGDTADATVTLPAAADYKAELIAKLEAPPITAEQLPPNVPLPDGEFPGGLPDRFQIVGVNPFALEGAETSEFEVTVEATCGTAVASAEVAAALTYATASGLRDVPLGRPVIFIGRVHVDEDDNGIDDETGAPTTYDWSLASVPAGSAAALVDATSQTPELTPDLPGVYTVNVTDTTRLPGTDIVAIEVHAGTWQGAITGEDADGLPLAENCTGCHDGDPAPDKFSPWRETGHAEIFTDLLNTNTHYGPACWSCHTVGYDPEVDNGGFDDAADFDAFLDAGLVNNPSPDNWSAMLAEFPDTASLSNAQCENCHGPQNGGAHTQGAPRTSLSANVCATCHGEPLRHGRFQQWQLSGHANYDLAIDEGESGSCARCHTANGFLAWLPILLDDDPLTDPVDDITVTWTADEVHPQTCATCHDPHDNGNVSGDDSNARVRISGNTPPLIGGFTALGVGKGAICMTCHNSRRGLRNDDTWADYVGTSEAARAPHGSVQADVLMGENAYLVNVGIRGNHSFVENTCVNCHMQRTPPPADLSYEQTGTNHTMFASDEICSQCHGSAFNATGVQEAFQATFDVLEETVVDEYLALFAEQITLGNVVVLELGGGVEQVVSDVATIEELALEEARGGLGLTFTIGGVTVGPLAFANIEIRDASNTTTCPVGFATCELYLFAEDDLLKAGWNWALVDSDGSRGVHNPSFVLGVLDASIDALER